MQYIVLASMDLSYYFTTKRDNLFREFLDDRGHLLLVRLIVNMFTSLVMVVATDTTKSALFLRHFCYHFVETTPLPRN